MPAIVVFTPEADDQLAPARGYNAIGDRTAEIRAKDNEFNAVESQVTIED
jgi:hypothetical protein